MSISNPRLGRACTSIAELKRFLDSRIKNVEGMLNITKMERAYLITEIKSIKNNEVSEFESEVRAKLDETENYYKEFCEKHGHLCEGHYLFFKHKWRETAEWYQIQITILKRILGGGKLTEGEIADMETSLGDEK